MPQAFRRAFSVALIVPIICGFAWTGYASYMAARQWYGFTILSQAGHAAPALAMNMAAYEAFPLEPAYRRQLPGILTLVVRTHGENMQLDPAAADLIAKVSRTVGPDDPAVLMPRAEYLLNFDRWREPEMADLMRRLSVSAAKIQPYWLLRAYYDAFRGDKTGALAAIDRGLALVPLSADTPDKFTRLKAELEKAE